jgi:hypothetical protein
MSIEISRETEARLTEQAWRLGISVDALLEGFIAERTALSHPWERGPGLPIWHLGSAGAR